MKASDLVAHLHSLGVTLQMRGGKFTVRNAKTLPSWLLQTVTAHRADLRALLERSEDRELQPVIAQHELQRFGFIQLETGVWCHPDGDEKGNRILLGLTDPAEIDAENARARDELIALGATPLPPKAIDPDVTQVGPGQYKWTEQAGQLYRDPFPKLTRIPED